MAVEHGTYIFFCSLFEAPAMLQTSAVYYSLDSFGAKLRIVDATAKAILEGPAAAQWEAFGKKLKEASQERNVLAHLTAVADFQADNSIQLVLAPAALFVPAQLQRTRTKKYDAAECERLAKRFNDLAQEIERFARGA